jgi:acetylornithine deacetylase/succinyl-diaminopimelate desuccinylase-like protein
LLLNKTWRPQLAVIGVDGMPTLEQAGNTVRTHTSVKLSIRIPPHVDAAVAAEAVKKILEADPPYGAHVTFAVDKTSSGWAAPPLAGTKDSLCSIAFMMLNSLSLSLSLSLLPDWLESSLKSASNEFFQQPPAFHGEGGTIPFMKMLGDQFPRAQFVVTGVLGPPNSSNAHGPNEFLHLAYTKKIICSVTRVLADYATKA